MAICNNKMCSSGECDQTETCTAYVPVISNGDRIRSMGDEELANYFERNFACQIFDDLPSAEYCKKWSDCKECWLIWLQQPAEEETP